MSRPITRLGILDRRVRHPHPWFGPMTAYEWHCLVFTTGFIVGN
jgi:hypothetical protein